MSYVLAMYDVRGKQEFIFRTNKMKEIVGGSLIIRDIFKDYLYSSANKVSEKGIYSYTDNKIDNAFSEDNWKKHLDEGYVGEVIYDGGGNFFVLFESEEKLIEINRIFTLNVMKEIGTLRVLCSYVTIENFDNYIEDERRLREVHRISENEESIIRPVNAIPFIQVDSNTSQPIVYTKIAEIHGQGVPTKTTQESYAKYKKYSEIMKSDSKRYGEQILDELVEEKGTDSMLAVVYIDGNNMGAKVSECLNQVNNDYESCIAKLRQFSSDIQKKYVDEPKVAIENKLNNRMVVFAGDEMSFVCKAKDGLKAVEAYFESLRKDESCSSCAGVALFHSHAPYHEVYMIAEECCENAKKHMKKANEKDTCYLDFQYCQGSLGMDLETIRQRETGELCSKPWLLSGKPNGEKVYDYDEIRRVVNGLNVMNARTNIKGLVSAAKESLQVFNMEMNRIYAHMSEDARKNANVKYIFEELDKGDHRRNIIYDIGIVYDQWFATLA